MSYVLAVDLGGSGLRAAIIGETGDIVALRREPLAFAGDLVGGSEADPDSWWNALLSVVGKLADEEACFAAVAAIAICGFTRTQVFLDGDGRPVRPAMTFRDVRGSAPVKRLMKRPEIRAHSAARHLNEFHPLARLLWLKENEPDSWAATRTVVEPKDYLIFRLTGRLCSDNVSQHWINLSYGEEDGVPSLAARVGIDRDIRPARHAPGALVGYVSKSKHQFLKKLHGAPVFCGSTDTWAGVVGSGALRDGRAYNISGTSEVFGVISNGPAQVDGLISMRWGESLWHLGGPSQGGASLLNWAKRHFSVDRDVHDLIDGIAGASHLPLIFLPFLNGERTPFWDADLRAAFVGLSEAHTIDDMIWAIAESLCFLNRIVLQRAETATGRSVEAVHFSGGGSRSAAWAQLKADILERPVVVGATPEAGLAGSAMVAHAGIDEGVSVDAVCDRFMSDATVFHPQTERAVGLDERYGIFLDAHQAITGISHKLAAHCRRVEAATGNRIQ